MQNEPVSNKQKRFGEVWHMPNRGNRWHGVHSGLAELYWIANQSEFAKKLTAPWREQSIMHKLKTNRNALRCVNCYGFLRRNGVRFTMRSSGKNWNDFWHRSER